MARSTCWVITFAALAVLSTGEPPDPSSAMLVRLPRTSLPLLSASVSDCDWRADDSEHYPGSVLAVMSAIDLKAYAAAGHDDTTVVVPDLSAWYAQRLKDDVDARLAASAQRGASSGSADLFSSRGGGTPRGSTSLQSNGDGGDDLSELLPDVVDSNALLGSMGGYMTYEEIVNWISAKKAAHPTLLTTPYVAGTSVHGSTMPSFVLTAPPASSGGGTVKKKQKMFLMSLLHAREPSGMVSLLYLADYLLLNYNRFGNVTRLLDEVEIHVLPVANPDGYMYNAQYQPGGGGMHRKNRRESPEGSNCGAGTGRGVDLNRNFGFRWGADDYGSSGRPCDMTYRGTKAFSEPETVAVQSLLTDHKFFTAMSFHAYGELLVLPCHYAHDCRAGYHNMAREATAVNGYKYGSSDETVGYGVNGDAADWMDSTGVWSLTPEVGSRSDGFWPTRDRALATARGNVNMTMTILEYGRRSLPSAASPAAAAGDGKPAGNEEPTPASAVPEALNNESKSSKGGRVGVAYASGQPSYSRYISVTSLALCVSLTAISI